MTDSDQSPLPIYKRPKDDKEDEAPTPHPTAAPKAAIPDVKLFENMAVISTKHCNDHCPALKRVVAVLNYFNSLLLNGTNGLDTKQRAQFIDFCDEHYGQKWLLDDYVHFMEAHHDTESTAKIAATLEWKCVGDINRCALTARHYRDRSRDDQAVHFYVETMDSVHFNVLHLVDVGLRVDLDLKAEDSKSDDS